MTISELLTEARRLDGLRAFCAGSRMRFEGLADAVSFQMSELRKNSVFARLPQDHHAKVHRELLAEGKEQRTAHLAVARFMPEFKLHQLRPQAAAFRQEVQEPPTVEAAYRTLTRSVGVSGPEMLALAQIELLGRSTLKPALLAVLAAERLRQYQKAKDTEALPVSAMTIAIVEELVLSHQVKAADESELADARELAKLVEDTRLSRIPPEFAEVEAIIRETEKEIGRVERHGIGALNPDHHPDFRKRFEDEEQRIAQEQERIGAEA